MPAADPRRQSGGPDSAGDALRRALDPVVAATGLDLEELTVTTVGRRRVVRVVVDADGGVDLDAVATVSRAISDQLERSDEPVSPDESLPLMGGQFAGPYVLEVTSPGVDRPLVTPRHWRRAIGRLVRVDVEAAPVTARVAAVDDSGVRLEADGTARTAPWATLGAGHVQIEFNPDAAARSASGPHRARE